MEVVDTISLSKEENLEEASDGIQRSRMFAELKLYCLELLELLQNPKKQSSSIPSLLQLFKNSSPCSMQPFFDYALFPLLLLLDAAVGDRSHQKVDSGENIGTSVVCDMSYRVSDRVAEGVLQCLEELLKKCHFRSVEQMVVMLKKLTYGALLSPFEASEEFREGVVKCFKAIFTNLCVCSDNSCSCKHMIGFPALMVNRDFQGHIDRFSEESKPNECLLEFLQSETASAAVGHWLSLLLKAADIEASRGHLGSSKLRIEAFMTLRILVAKVGTADGLAFFLPGVVSQFFKVLQACRTMLSGAAGNTEAMNQAIRGLAEYLMIVLEDDANISSLDMLMDVQTDILPEKGEKAQYFLEELRQLPVKVHAQRKKVEALVKEITNKSEPKEKVSANYLEGNKSFHVNRTKEWVADTSTHVDKLLGATFPYICVHPAKKVRLGLLAAVKGLLLRCNCTLKASRLMLLECLCALAVDDSDDVSHTAQEFIEYLFLRPGNYQFQLDIGKIFVRLVEKLPNVVLGRDENFALSQARQLLVVAYYSGPQLIINHFIQSPVTAVHFLDVFAVCLNQNSVYASSLGKFLSARPSSLGYLHSLTELKVGTKFINNGLSIMDASSSKVQELTMIQEIDTEQNVQKNHVLPRMPPWFNGVGSQRLYEALGGVLRLVGSSLVSDSKSEGSLSVTIDIPLGNLQKLVFEIRAKEYSEESWEHWYKRIGSGRLVREASTAVCILNEMIYGVSEHSVDYLSSVFQRARLHRKVAGDLEYATTNKSMWIFSSEKVQTQLIDCIGRILHEYLSSEIWDLPIEHKSCRAHPAGEEENVHSHFFRDIAMLHQVIIEGIGIFSMCLGKDFASCGFLHSSLYLLLENLISSNVEVRSTSDAVLRVISSTSGYPTVGNLVLENADYVIDSICRQLRHLDLNPHVPNVLAAILSYIGIAHEILPLLEEPMHSVSAELEILGRHQHPNLTVPFLKAVAEIVRVSMHESNSLPIKAASNFDHVKSIISNEGQWTTTDTTETSRSYYDDGVMESGWENVLFKFNDSRRYRRTVGSIANSCIVAAIPLLASQKLTTCLVALDIVEHGIGALAKVEEAYKHEKNTKETIEEVLQSHSFYRLLDTLDVSDDGSDENRLLPAMNKIWPFLVACIQNKNPAAVRRCLNVISNSVQVCGGDFFARRFYTDGSRFWKLLSMSPFQRKHNSREEKAVLQLPYRTLMPPEDSIAEVSNLKVQATLLNMIADLSRNSRSASALEVVLKKVSGLVAGVAFSGVMGLREASMNALDGLASIDPDLIWLLVADVYYTMKKDAPPLPPTSDFPDVCEVLPPPLSQKEYLYVLYGGPSYGFDINVSSVEFVFKRLQSQVSEHGTT